MAAFRFRKYGDPTFHGGAFYNYDPKYFRGTILSQFRSPDYGNWDVIAEVAPKAKARGMDFFCWDYNNESRRMMQNMPNAAKTAEIDIVGRRMIGPASIIPITGHIRSAKSRATFASIRTKWPESRGAANGKDRSKT
jgi:hypothetical protein